MTPRTGWKQPEIGVHPPLFHWRRIDPFRTLLPDSSTAWEQVEATVGPYRPCNYIAVTQL